MGTGCRSHEWIYCVLTWHLNDFVLLISLPCNLFLCLRVHTLVVVRRPRCSRNLFRQAALQIIGLQSCDSYWSINSHFDSSHPSPRRVIEWMPPMRDAPLHFLTSSIWNTNTFEIHAFVFTQHPATLCFLSSTSLFLSLQLFLPLVFSSFHPHILIPPPTVLRPPVQPVGSNNRTKN